MSETIEIKVVDSGPPPERSSPNRVDMRHNPDLDAAFGVGSGGPNFPTTVLGMDGKAYSLKAYEAAAKRIRAESAKDDDNAAYEAFSPKIQQEKMSREQAKAEKNAKVEQAKKDRENERLQNEQARAMAKEQAQKAFVKYSAERTAASYLDPSGGALAHSADLIGGGALKMGNAAALGAVLPIFSAAMDGATKSAQRLTAGVNRAGDALSTFAGNERQGVAMLGQSIADGIKDSVRSIPIIGEAAGATMDLQQSIINLPEKLTTAFVAQAQRLSNYSGDIAGANARADVRSIMADFREARELGDGYGRMIDAQSRLDNTIREMLLPIKKFIVEVLASRLELLADGANIVKNLPEILMLAVEKGVQGIATIWSDDTLADVIKDFRDKVIKLLEKDTKPEDFFNEFFDAVDNMKLGANAFSG